MDHDAPKNERLRYDWTPSPPQSPNHIHNATNQVPPRPSGSPNLSPSKSLRGTPGTSVDAKVEKMDISDGGQGVKPERDRSPSESHNVKVEKIDASIVVESAPGKAPKLSRKASQKVIARPPPMFNDEPDRWDEATASFSVITDCIYSNKYMGSTEPALECDCSEEWDPAAGANEACSEDSDCINRATKMECIADCSCGHKCYNQRFARKQWAKVTVFKTEKKGFGLRADKNLRPNEFIFEYVGEVINEPNFRKRTRQYDEEGIKHFYFMSLNKGEFIDATKKGNLGRFCNHSCNPNCYVDKWVVGDKLRMGIFAERAVKAGEELVFNYNVDRYGADPQPCYCGEPNCTGFIGGKTQTERGTKLPTATIEALGIEDFDDWDTAIPKKPKKARKTGEDDEEYVSNIQSKSLDERGVTKVMAALMTCKEKWIAVKLLDRIQQVDDERVINRVVRMHGYRILKAALNNFPDDANIHLQVLDVFFKLPRITRNKIQDSGIEEVVLKLKTSEDERVRDQATSILDIWSALEMAYRIPRVKRDPNALPVRTDRLGRRGEAHRDRTRSRSRSTSPVAAPTGPRSSIPQRGAGPGPQQLRRPRPPPFRGGINNNAPLPPGWFEANNGAGRIYYYSSSGQTTWTRPLTPADMPPAPPRQSHEERLQAIINSITQAGAGGSNGTPGAGVSPATATPKEEEKKKKKEPKWKSLSEEKQKRIYENTLAPHISHVMNKYKHKLPRDDIKRFAKDIAKKLVASDFKKNRVKDPHVISSKHEHTVKQHVREFFDRAVVKHREREKKLRDKERERRKREGGNSGGSGATGKTHTPPGSPTAEALRIAGRVEAAAEKEKQQDKAKSDDDEDMQLTDHEMSDLDDDEDNVPAASGDRKRKRDDGAIDGGLLEAGEEDGDVGGKRARTVEGEDAEDGAGLVVPPPPPPPPPPEEEEQVEEEGDEQGKDGLGGANETRGGVEKMNGVEPSSIDGQRQDLPDASDMTNDKGAAATQPNGTAGEADAVGLEESPPSLPVPVVQKTQDPRLVGRI